MQEKARNTKTDMEKASKRGKREGWLKDEGCPELNNEARWSLKNCRSSRLNSVKSDEGIKLNKNRTTAVCFR